jgi:hypothetical protein
MKNWTNKKRIALKSAVGALAKRVGGLARRSARFPRPINLKAAPPALARQESSVNGREHRSPAPGKRVHRAALAVEDGFKEF